MNKKKDKFNVALGSLMREHRKLKRLSMREFGEKVGISGQMVSLYELGDASITVTLLKKFCEVYGTKYYEMIEQASILAGDNKGD